MEQGSSQESMAVDSVRERVLTVPVKGATGGSKEYLIGLLRDRWDAARAFDAEKYTPVYGFTPGTPVRSSGEDCGTHDALSCRRRSENLPASEVSYRLVSNQKPATR